MPNDAHLVTARLTALAQAWRVTVEASVETERSVIAYGWRGTDAVVLKVVKAETSDEWRSGEVTAAFAGRAFVRALEQTGGAVLLERIRPGRDLVDLARGGRDDEATAILADVVAAMAPNDAPSWCGSVADWGRGFAWYATTDDRQISGDLVARAAAEHEALSATQRATRLLHGDLQHSNVLEDRERGWLAVDPKGVVGEVECEMAALLRNPSESPAVFADPARVERRVAVLSSRLGLDTHRILRWTFALGVLSAIWQVEDGQVVDPVGGPLALVRVVQAILGHRS